MPCPSPALSHKANNFQPDSVAVGVEKEFEQWLAQRLIAERTAVVSQLQEQIAIALTIHREALLAEMTTVCRITAQQHKTVGEVSNSEGGLPSLFKVKSDGQEQKAASKEAAKKQPTITSHSKSGGRNWNWCAENSQSSSGSTQKAGFHNIRR